MTTEVYAIRAQRRRFRAGLRRARRFRLAVAAGGAGVLALVGCGVAAAAGGGSARPMVIFLPDGQPLVQGKLVPGGYPRGGRMVDVPGGIIWERPAGDDTQPPAVTVAPWVAG